MENFLYHLAIFRAWLITFDSRRELEEDYREEFEREMLASGDFKCALFTVDERGRYHDQRLQARWEEHLSNTAMLDCAH